MRNLSILLITILLVGCKHKETNLNSDAPLKPNQFVAAFKTLDNNFSATDSSILSLADTVSINHKLLQRFIPDALFKRLLTTDNKTTFHPLGKIEKNNEVYLLLLSIHNKKQIVTVIVQDKKNVFLASKDVLPFDRENSAYKYSFSLNREPTFYVSREKLVNEKSVKYTKTGWAFNGKIFIAVVSESNERNDKSNAILNPIDTLPRENLYSGNYVEDEGNFISVRDGRTKQDYLFFLHIDKNEGNCVGELKGEMKLTDSTHGIYSFGGDPCVIDFTFDRNVITIKEKGSCGNRRGMDCFFEDAYTKKKEPKKKVIKPVVVKVPTANITKMLVPTKANTKVDKKKSTKPKLNLIVPIKPAPKTEENPYTN
jgi:hypothetical protein